jgi:aerobic carbon-monoxide dehydrogenase medium subunit
MTVEIRPLPPFEYASPKTLAEAIQLLAAHGASAKLLAGGTDLLPRMKIRKDCPTFLIDLNRIDSLSFIEVRGTALHIGAGTRLAALHDSAIVRDKAAALADAAHVMSSPGIRNRATIGGNLCNASRCADTPAPLIALDASVTLLGPGGERRVPIVEFFAVRGACSGKTVVSPDEVMTEIIIPTSAGRSAFTKLGRRRGSSTAIVSVAACVSTANGKFDDVRVAVSAFGSTPVRGETVETALRGASVDGETIARAAGRIKDEITPIGDHRASAAYRKEMAAVLIRRVLTRLAMGEA